MSDFGEIAVCAVMRTADTEFGVSALFSNGAREVAAPAGTYPSLELPRTYSMRYLLFLLDFSNPMSPSWWDMPLRRSWESRYSLTRASSGETL